jgi:hypothetical protein
MDVARNILKKSNEPDKKTRKIDERYTQWRIYIKTHPVAVGCTSPTHGNLERDEGDLDDVEIGVDRKSDEMSEEKDDGEEMMIGDDIMGDEESNEFDDDDEVESRLL